MSFCLAVGLKVISVLAFLKENNLFLSFIFIGVNDLTDIFGGMGELMHNFTSLKWKPILSFTLLNVVMLIFAVVDTCR